MTHHSRATLCAQVCHRHPHHSTVPPHPRSVLGALSALPAPGEQAQHCGQDTSQSQHSPVPMARRRAGMRAAVSQRM